MYEQIAFDAASPGPNNAEKEGAGRGENEGEREP
jgi:hypothetical protein